MKVCYRKCDRCGKREDKGYWGDIPENENYPMYTMRVSFGMDQIRYDGKYIPNQVIDLCDECLGFFLKELKRRC